MPATISDPSPVTGTPTSEKEWQHSADFPHFSQISEASGLETRILERPEPYSNHLRHS